MTMRRKVLVLGVVTTVLLLLWYAATLNDFHRWEQRALVEDGMEPPTDRSATRTAVDHLKYLLGINPLQDREVTRWPGESDSRHDGINSFVALVLLMTSVSFVVAIGRGVPLPRMVAAVLTLFSGVVHLLVSLGQAIGVAVAAFRPSATYDWGLYSLALYCMILAVPAFSCILSVMGLTRGESEARRRTLWSSMVLLVVNVPLLPIWTVPGLAVKGFIGIFLPSLLAAANVLVLFLLGGRFPNARTSRAIVT